MKYFRYLLVIGGIIGFIAAFLLTTEKIELLKNASYQPPCNINPILSCGSVMKTWQASVFGFPNSLIGIFGFAVVITIGMAMFAGATFKRWFWLGLEAGTIFGIVFIHWLFFQSVFVIGVLCPYCMVVWSVMIPIFLYTTLYNLKAGNIKTAKPLKGFVKVLQTYHRSVLVLWYLAIIVAIGFRFWYFWRTLI
jgi:uncharacterized membrane protein